MAKKDKIRAKDKVKDTSASKDNEDNLGLDLSADPEFLALAADFDAAVKKINADHAGGGSAADAPAFTEQAEYYGELPEGGKAAGTAHKEDFALAPEGSWTEENAQPENWISDAERGALNYSDSISGGGPDDAAPREKSGDADAEQEHALPADEDIAALFEGDPVTEGHAAEESPVEAHNAGLLNVTSGPIDASTRADAVAAEDVSGDASGPLSDNDQTSPDREILAEAEALDASGAPDAETAVFSANEPAAGDSSMRKNDDAPIEASAPEASIPDASIPDESGMTVTSADGEKTPAREEPGAEHGNLPVDAAAPEDDSKGDGTATKPEKGGIFARRGKKRQAGNKTDKAERAQQPRLPRLSATPSAEPTVLSRVFDILSLGGIFVLGAVFLAQVVPALHVDRLLWFSDELRLADVLSGVFDGNWLQIKLNGELYQEAPPFYFWFLAGLHRVLALLGMDLGDDYARLLYYGSAASGFLFLMASLGLARFTARLDRRGTFAAGCVLSSVLFLQFFFHYSSIDLFFAAFIIASHIFMFRALMRSYSPVFMGLAFLCAAVALMTKGALGLVLPVLSAVLFCLWRGKPQRLLKGDFILGILFALLPVTLWLGNIWAGGQHDVVLKMLKEQIWVKAFGKAWHNEAWWYYLAVLPALWLPWSFVPLAAPWRRVFSRDAWAALKSSRNGDRQGLAFIWMFLIGAFVLISFINHKQPVYLVPLMGPLAVVTGRATLRLSPFGSAMLQRIMAAFFFFMAVAFVLLPVYYSGDTPSFFSWLGKLDLPEWEVKVNGIFLLAVVMLGLACLLVGVLKARRPESTLLVVLVGVTLFSYPLSTMTMPSLDPVVSSRSASVELRRYADLGYYPVSFKIYSGVFSYYSGMTVKETADWTELERIVAAHPKVIVAMSASRWEEWTQHPGFTEVMRFWMFSVEYVLLGRNVTPDVLPLWPLDLFPLPDGFNDGSWEKMPPEADPAGPSPDENTGGSNSEIAPDGTGSFPEEDDFIPEVDASTQMDATWQAEPDSSGEFTTVDENAPEDTPDGAVMEEPDGNIAPPGEEPLSDKPLGDEPSNADPLSEAPLPDAGLEAYGREQPAEPLVEIEESLEVDVPGGLPLSDSPTPHDPFSPIEME